MAGGVQRTGAAGVAIVLLVLFGTAAIPAETLADQQQALGRARAQAEEARLRSTQLEASAAGAAAEADRARASAAAMAARVQQAEAELRGAGVRIRILDRLQRVQAQRLAIRQAPIARLTAGLQMIARRPAALALIQPDSIASAVHLRIVLGRVLPVIAARTAGLRAELARSRAGAADAALAQAALARSRDQLAGRRADLARIEATRRIAARQFRDSAAIEAERALAIGEEARDIVDLMQRMEDAGAVRGRLAALPGPVLRPASPGTALLPADDPAPGSAARPAYRLPVVGDIVTGFGEVADSGVRSRGLTLATEPGATVVAPAPGRIAFAGPFRDYGSIVIIDHGAGWTSLVTHMRRLSVSVGDTVRQGDPMGVTGTSQPRITIELRRAERPVDIGAMLR